MDKVRLRLVAGLAGVTLAVFAAASYGQNTNSPATAQPTADQSAQQPTSQATGAQPQTGTDQGGAAIGTSSRTTTTATDVTTTSPTTTTFWLGPWGLLAIAVVVILVLWAIFGRRGSTVVRDTYSSSSSSRTAPTNERVVSPRAASGTETTTRTTDTDTRL
jgi:hypothetical protein